MLAEACCATNVGLEFDGGLQIGDSVADVRTIRTGNGRRRGRGVGGGGIVSRVEQALQNAIHPGTSGGAGRDFGGSAYSSGADIIPFPVVNPYKPLIATRAPVAGLTAFPALSKRMYFNGEQSATVNGRGDDKNEKPLGFGPSGFEGLGFLPGPSAYPSGVSLPQSGPTNLQTILGTIATTLPATISAIKGRPYYDPTGSVPYITGAQHQQQQVAYQTGQGEFYSTGAGSDIGARAGATVGGIGDAIAGVVRDYPLLVLGGGAAVLLLMLKPPGRR